MSRIECAHESDVILYVSTGRWPDRAPADLRAHADGCEVCGPLGIAAVAVEAEASAPPPALPSAGTVWWRAQLRARQELTRKAVRPITVAHALAFAAAAGLAGAVFGATASWFQGGVREMWHAARAAAGSIHLPTPSLPESFAAGGLGSWVLAGVIACTLAALAIVGWALREE